MIRLEKITLWEEIKRAQLLPWTKPQSSWKISITVGSRPCGCKAAMTSDRVVSGLMLPLWEEVQWPLLDAWDSVRTGRVVSSSFFLLKKEPMVLRELVRFGPSIPVEAAKACALVGLHMVAEEDCWRSDSGFSVSSSDSCEDNVGNDALHVIGLKS